jgi:chitinase
VVDDALSCLASGADCGSFVPPQTWPGIRGVMTWSINWDAANGYNFADTVSPYLSTLP